MSKQHTKAGPIQGPYIVSGYVEADYPLRRSITNGRGSTIAEKVGIEDAAFIVKACNSHEELLEALKFVLDQAGIDPKSPSYKKAEEAIAHAEGRV